LLFISVKRRKCHTALLKFHIYFYRCRMSCCCIPLGPFPVTINGWLCIDIL
jgi:hypothetical protein